MSTKYKKSCFAKLWITFIDLPIRVKVKKFLKTVDAKTKQMNGYFKLLSWGAHIYTSISLILRRTSLKLSVTAESNYTKK